MKIFLQKAASYSHETFANIRTVFAFNIQTYSQLIFHQKLIKSLPAAKKKAFGMGISLGLLFFILFGVCYSIGLFNSYFQFLFIFDI